MPYIPRIPSNLHLVTNPEEGPAFDHDCSSCHFLGRYGSADSGRGPADLYVHNTGFDPTVIARYSSEGSNYGSGSPFSYGRMPDLTEARRRAQVLGLWEYDVTEALFHASKEYPGPYAEMTRALPFTLEYQAALAFEAGDTERHQSLLTVLLQDAHAKRLKYRPTDELGASLIEVEAKIARVVAVYRDHSDVATMKKLDGIGEFLRDLFRAGTLPRVIYPPVCYLGHC